MSVEPDLITESGRESMTLQDRMDLLESDLMREPFLGITQETRASSQTIHDLKVTIGYVRGTVDLYRQAKRRGTADELLQRGARSMVSPAECWILAWRRGGHAEWKRVVKLQRNGAT